MTEKELETAIQAHEMQRLELKESFGSECIETASAFANPQGGRIVLPSGPFLPGAGFVTGGA